jgi:hypothetical protein
MTEKLSDARHFSDLKGLYDLDAAQALLQGAGHELTPQMARWLARLCLLYGVPFNHLVADERMLPMESIRFFYVDQNWLDSLVDGALSVGTYSTRDTTYKKLMRPVVRMSARKAVTQVRAALRGEALNSDPEPAVLMTGLLLRSALVSDWPGLEIRAYDTIYSPPDSPPDAPSLAVLRMDRLSSNVLLCIFAGPIRQVEINQPSEGLHFGVEPIGSPPKPLIAPRGVGGAIGAGHQITTDMSQWVEAVWRQEKGTDTRVLNVAALKENLSTQLQKLKAIEEGVQIGPAEFAIQMVKAPFQQIFNNNAPPPPAAAAESESVPAGQDVRQLEEHEIMSSLFGS